MTDAAATATPRRKPRSRRRRIVLAILAGLIVAFYCFVTFRGPRDYAGELARLLPARTSAFVALNDFEGIRQRIGETQLYAQLRESIDLAALLMTSEDWRAFQKDKEGLKWQAKATLARGFLRRYFSRQVVVALARLDGCDEAALLVMARTDLGFMEKVAELCASLYPELRLAIERYRDIPIYAYEGKESKRSFTFVRFGKTVVLSLRSGEREYLRRVIDYRLDGPGETLFETAAFRQAWRSPARRQGLLAFGQTRPLFEDLYSRPDFKMRRHLPEARRARLERGLAAFRSVEVAITVGDRMDANVVLSYDPATSGLVPPATAERPLALLDTVPGNCLGFASLRFTNLAETIAMVLNVHRAFSEEADDPQALERAVARLNAEWGLDVARDLAPALGGEAALVIHDIKLPMLVEASLLVPVSDRRRAEAAVGRLVANFADRGAAAPEIFRQEPSFHPLYPTPMGFLGVACEGDYCVWGLNPGGYRATRRMLDGEGSAITRSALFRLLDLPIKAPLDAAAFVNLEEIGLRAEGVLPVLALASKSVRERSAKYGKIIAVTKLLRGLGLYARRTKDDLTVVLRVPTR